MDAVEREYAAAKAAHIKALARLKKAKAALPPPVFTRTVRTAMAYAENQAKVEAQAARNRAEKVREQAILARFDQGVTKKAVATEFGTTPAVVARIVKNRRWIEGFDAQGAPDWRKLIRPHYFDEDGNLRTDIQP